jgi:phage gp46-like protein
MTEPIIREAEGLDAPVSPSWDTVWVNFDPNNDLPQLDGSGDFALADPDLEPRNIGGLRSISPLGSAVFQCLFTNKRRPDELMQPGLDRQGWAGDTFDIIEEDGERELGSLLYTLERSAIDYDTMGRARAYAAESLATLIDQGRVREFEIVVEADKAKGFLIISVTAVTPVGDREFIGTWPANV